MSYILLILFFVAAWGIIKPFRLPGFTPRRWHFAVATLVLFVGFGASLPPPDPTVGTVAATTKVAATGESMAGARGDSAVKSYAAQLRREIASMHKGNTLKDVPKDKEGITIATAMIGARVKIFQDRPPHHDAKIKDMEREYIQLAKAYQKDAFPKLRKAMASYLDTKMWENDIDVSAIGSGNKKLKLTGGIFAANAGIKAAHEGLIETLHLLRFDEDRYEWYPGSQWQGYTMQHTPRDGDFAALTDGGTSWEVLNQPESESRI